MHRHCSAPASKPKYPRGSHRLHRPRLRNRARIDYNNDHVYFFLSSLRQNPTTLALPRQPRWRTQTHGEPVLLFPLFHLCFVPSRRCSVCPEVDSAMNESFRACPRYRPILSDSERLSSTPRRPRWLIPTLLHLQHSWYGSTWSEGGLAQSFTAIKRTAR
jgi:hypothetical protein